MSRRRSSSRRCGRSAAIPASAHRTASAVAMSLTPASFNNDTTVSTSPSLTLSDA